MAKWPGSKGEEMASRFKPVDIILVNYNSTDHLLRCLGSIFDDLGEMKANVYVQDNASGDKVERVTKVFPQVKLSRNRDNIGFSKSVNKALRASDSDYVLILNPDTYVVKGFFGPVSKFMDDHPEVGIAGPRIINNDGSLQGSARSNPTPLTAFFGRSSVLSKYFPGNPLTSQNLLTSRSDGLTPMEVDWVSGACMLVRRAAVDEVGLLDERFFMYWEDADWCKRMWQKGWKIVYFPQASLVHYVGGSSNTAFLRSNLEFHKSSYRLFRKSQRSPVKFLSPLVIFGLAFRMSLVLLSNGLPLWYGRLKSSAKSMEAPMTSHDERGKIKVLRLLGRLNIGGPSVHVHVLTRGLDTDRFQTILVTGKISPQEGDMSYLFDHQDSPVAIPELQREISLRLDFQAILHIFRILRRERPDIVHSHTAKAGSSARLAATAYNLLFRRDVRIVHTFHGHVFDGYFSRPKSLVFVLIERFLARMTDTIIAISESQKQELARKYRIAPPEKIHTIGLGFDLRPFLAGRALQGEFRNRLGIDDDSLLIGIIGRLVPIKNHVMFFGAAKLFLDQNPGLKIVFVVGGDGELKDELEAYSEKLGIAGHVRFCGWIKDVPSLYADLDILALTSRNEGTPVSIIEAMASSVPVIATDAGGVRDLLGPPDGGPSAEGFVVCERGILCGKDDIQGFSNGLKYLVDADGDGNGNRTRRARSFVEKAFSQSRLLKDIEALYLELAEKDKVRDEGRYEERGPSWTISHSSM